MRGPWNFRRALALATVCALLTAGALASSTAKEPAPRFTAKTTDGETFNNGSIQGKVGVLDDVVRLLRARSATGRQSGQGIGGQRADSAGHRRRRIQKDGEEIPGAASPELQDRADGGYESGGYVSGHGVSDLCGDRSRR